MEGFNPMNDIKVPVEVDPNEDTEWNDILRAHGVIPEKPPSPTQELENALEEAIKKQHENRLENKDLDELNELEDEEDEDFLNSYKQKRMNELKELQKASKFGAVMPISKSEYEKEVTLDSANHFVVLHMSADSQIQSRLLGSLLNQLAPKYPEIKFLDIPASRCIENYPPANIPTLLVYHNKDVVRQYITLTELGGNSTTLKDVENALVRAKAITEQDSRLIINQDEFEDGKRVNYRQKARKELEDEDDDFYD